MGRCWLRDSHAACTLPSAYSCTRLYSCALPRATEVLGYRYQLPVLVADRPTDRRLVVGPPKDDCTSYMPPPMLFQRIPTQVLR